MKKQCTECKKELSATKEFFHYQKNGLFDLRSKCKECLKVYRKIYTSTDKYKKKHREKQAEWRRLNPQKQKEVTRKTYHKHKERINSERRDRYLNDPEFKDKCLEREKIYLESGRRREMGRKPETLEKSRVRSSERRKDKELYDHDLKRNEQYRKDNKKYLHDLHTANRKDLVPSYVAQSMRMSVKDLTPEVYETKKLIIELKRELKSNNVKIR